MHSPSKSVQLSSIKDNIINLYHLLLRSCITLKKCLLEHLKMDINTAIVMNEILDTVLGDDSDGDIDLGYEKNVYNEVSGWDNKSMFLLFLFYLKNLLFP